MKHKRNLKEFRERILQLDNHECQNPECPRLEIPPDEWIALYDLLSAHHIKYRSQGGDESDGNGISFCADCDRKAHHGYTDKNGKRVIAHKFVYDVLLSHKGKYYDRWRFTREALKLIVERKSNEEMYS